jgi:FkbM family methyltransferase
MLRLKILIANILTTPFIGLIISKIYDNLLPYRGLNIYVENGLVTNRTKAHIFWGFYEGAEIRFIDKYFPVGLDTVELGSSIGVVSCYIRKKMAEENKLICIEAFPKLCVLGSKNLRLNDCSSNSVVLNSAINYSKEGVDIFFNPGSSNTTGSISTIKASKDSINIDKTTLSLIIDNNSIKEYILVMDIEGAEIEIFLYEGNALIDCRHLFVELHETEFFNSKYSVTDMIDILTRKHKFNLVDRYDNVCYFNK